MWKITNDLLNTDKNDRLCRIGKTSSVFSEKAFEQAEKIQIRLLDDDGEVYFVGLATKKSILDAGEDIAFDALDWAMADAGCTELQYKNEAGEWETL